MFAALWRRRFADKNHRLQVTITNCMVIHLITKLPIFDTIFVSHYGERKSLARVRKDASDFVLKLQYYAHPPLIPRSDGSEEICGPLARNLRPLKSLGIVKPRGRLSCYFCNAGVCHHKPGIFASNQNGLVFAVPKAV